MNIIQLVVNHYNAGVEHQANAMESIPGYDREFKTTMFQAIRLTAYDLLFNKTIYLKEYKSHLIYEVKNIHTVGFRYAEMVRLYVPPEHRGKNIASKMLDMIPETFVIGHSTLPEMIDKYHYIGSIFLLRSNWKKGDEKYDNNGNLGSRNSNRTMAV